MKALVARIAQGCNNNRLTEIQVNKHTITSYISKTNNLQYFYIVEFTMTSTFVYSSYCFNLY